MRKYQPIWENIKTNGHTTIVAPPIVHARIIQAVRKEKWRDMGWKFLLAEKNLAYDLQQKVAKEKIHFFLADCRKITPQHF